MGFSARQIQALRRNPGSRHIRTRETNGRELFYIEGWYAISEANRIFGFDGWSRETLASRCVLARENQGAFVAVYTAKVRITVQADGTAMLIVKQIFDVLPSSREEVVHAKDIGAVREQPFVEGTSREIRSHR